MAMTFRDVKGSPLISDEIDENFRTLQAMIEDLESNIPAGVSVTGFVVTGTTFKVSLSDGTFRGPYDLPVAPAWRWREELTPNSVYSDFDVFSYTFGTPSDGVYLVIGAYESPADLGDFDPDALADDTEGGPALQKLIGRVPESVILNTIFESTVLTEDMAGLYTRCENEDPILVEVPLHSEDPIGVGSVFTFRWAAAGSVSIAGTDPGVIIVSPETLNLRKLGATATLVKVGEDLWDLAGDLELLPAETSTEGTEGP